MPLGIPRDYQITRITSSRLLMHFDVNFGIEPIEENPENLIILKILVQTSDKNFTHPDMIFKLTFFESNNIISDVKLKNTTLGLTKI